MFVHRSNDRTFSVIQNDTCSSLPGTYAPWYSKHIHLPIAPGVSPTDRQPIPSPLPLAAWPAWSAFSHSLTLSLIKFCFKENGRIHGPTYNLDDDYTYHYKTRCPNCGKRGNSNWLAVYVRTHARGCQFSSWKTWHFFRTLAALHSQIFERTIFLDN